MSRFAATFFIWLAAALPAAAQTYYDVDVDLPAYPEMAPVPDSPVYYAPGVDSNYFFYDGQFWDFSNETWFSSTWYNGPWEAVDPVYVPTYVLWVPIAYYHRPPAYFRNWHRERPPRWGERWGRDWQQRHNAVHGSRSANPLERAPLPEYQRNFTRANYPRGPQQWALHAQHYGYRGPAAATRQPLQKFVPLKPGFIDVAPAPGRR